MKNQLKALTVTYKMLYVAGMKTESEFAGVSLDFLENMVFHLHSEEIM
jgi:hypothetical protein